MKLKTEEFINLILISFENDSYTIIVRMQIFLCPSKRKNVLFCYSFFMSFNRMQYIISQHNASKTCVTEFENKSLRITEQELVFSD